MRCSNRRRCVVVNRADVGIWFPLPVPGVIWAGTLHLREMGTVERVELLGKPLVCT